MSIITQEGIVMMRNYMSTISAVITAAIMSANALFFIFLPLTNSKQ